ncbi:hypothetical protein DL96DRAFT_1758752 [Flagelloscypha sp. PMI_526]|nr:hypothetical protein DL96DRAFT_1758752 [Flagelloscypha sp. PMI_526]
MVDQIKNEEQPGEQPNGDKHDIIFNRDKPSAEATFFAADQDEAAQEATQNPRFKPLLRLCQMFVRNEDDKEFEWYVPSGILLSNPEARRKVITQFLDDPIDLDGKTARQCLSKNVQSDEETKKKR